MTTLVPDTISTGAVTPEKMKELKGMIKEIGIY